MGLKNTVRKRRDSPYGELKMVGSKRSAYRELKTAFILATIAKSSSDFDISA